MALENEYMLEELTAEEIYQKKLTAGANITINPITNEISSTGGGSSVQYTSNYAQGDILGTLNIDGASSAIRTPNLVEGENISITRDQQTGAVTISSTGGSGDLSAHELTEEAYNALTPAEKTNGELYLTHPATVGSSDPNKIYYNNTLYGTEGGNDVVELTQAEWDALPSSKLTDGIIYVITDSGGGGGASTISDLTDVELTDLANGEILKYDAIAEKWINAVESKGNNGIHIPPVIFDDGNLKKVNDVDGFPGLEKVFLAPSDYEALTQTEKEDLSKIYYVSEYDYYSDKGGTLVLRVKKDEIKLFVNGFVDENTELKDGNLVGLINDKIRELVGSYFIGSIAYDENKEPIGGSLPYVYIDANYSRIAFRNASGGSSNVIHTTTYAVIDLTNYSSSQGSVLQSNPWEDPYDISGGMTIYYGDKQYSNFNIPNPLPEITFSDNGKVLKVVNGVWTAGVDNDGSEAVYLPLADYEELTTAEKEDPTKIYFVINEGTKVSPTLTADDGNVSASSDYGRGTAPWKALDGVSLEKGVQPYQHVWLPWEEHGGEWWQYNFATGNKFSKISFNAASENTKNNTMGFKVEASNDGETWTPITYGTSDYIDYYLPAKDTSSDNGFNWVNIAILLDCPINYSKIRLNVDKSVYYPYSNNGMMINNIQIYAAAASNKPSIYYKNVLYNPDELPVTTISDAGKVLKVNEDGLWNKGDIREVPAITLSDEKKILTVESGTATWASPKKITHLYDVIPLENPLYRIGSITPSTSPVTIDMTQITPNYSELLSTDFEFVFMQDKSDLCMRAWYGNPIDNTPGTFSYTPNTGELIATLRGGFTGGQFGIAYKKSVIQISQPALVSGSTATIDCSDIPNAETLTVADFALVITNVYEPSTSNNGNISLGYSFSYNQTTKTFSGYVGAGDFNQLTVSGYFIVANYGDPEYRLITDFQGASASSDGYHGFVPAPLTADRANFLRGDGTWAPNDKAYIFNALKYSETEQQVGVWIDNKPLYQITYDAGSDTSISYNSWVNITIEALKDCENIVMGYGTNNGGTYTPLQVSWTGNVGNKTVQVQTSRNGYNQGVRYFTFLYTKTTDSAGSGGYQAYGFSPIIYSEEEREVGVWIDNKPLYQKTFYKLNQQSSFSDYVDFAELVGVETVVSMLYNVNRLGIWMTAVSANRPELNNTNYFFGVRYYNNHVQYRIDTYETQITDMYVTIQYTKTTDVAGSGSYNILGVPTVHYDMTEQVIGTFLGKPLYQKTFDWSSSPVNIPSTWFITTIDSTNIERVIDCKGHHSDGTFYTTDADPTGDNHTKLKMRNNGGGGTYSYVTLEYTKIND